MVTAVRLSRRDFAAGAALIGGSLLAPRLAFAQLVEAPMRMPPGPVAGPKFNRSAEAAAARLGLT
jgi:hypothetical protein